MDFTREQKLDFMKSLMWDYDIPPEHCLEVLEGTREKAGHYTEETLFRKTLESFPWFTIIRIISISRVKNLLTDSVTRSLRFKILTERYELIKGRLQDIV